MNSAATPLDPFDRVVVINLARRSERMHRFNQLFQTWPFKPPQRFEAIDGSAVEIHQDWKHGPGAWGCMLSHRAVLGAAIADKISTLLVLEDDAFPAPDFTPRSADFLARVPSDWDCLMFGAEHMRPPIPVSPGIVRCVASNRTHAFALRGPMMPILLGFWNHFKTDHCDIVLSSLMRHFKAYAPDPFLIGQDAGFSDITARCEPARFLSAETSIPRAIAS
jgi:Glycosyltransferase family 25 (LPS biosynthesis protein)